MKILSAFDTPVNNLSTVSELEEWLEELKHFPVDDGVAAEFERVERFMVEARKREQGA